MVYKSLFYFDIETVGNYRDLESFKLADEKGFVLFKHKYENNPWMHDRGTLEEAYLNNAPVISTFGKIVCISFGYFHNKTVEGYTIKSLYGENEEEIIIQFQDLLNKVGKRHMLLSGYYIKGFDVPWIIHKMNKYDLEPPKLVDVYGKKPWENGIVDIAEEWKQQNRNSTSLNELAYELGIDIPVDEIDGGGVHKSYWEENDLNTIKIHCEADVFNTMKVAERMFKYKMV